MAASRRIRIILVSIAAVLAALVIAAFVLVNRFQPIARSYVISALRDRYNSDVELGDFQISLFPLVHATGDNLVFYMKGRKEGLPLIRIRRFTVDARFIGFFRYPRRIRSLTLEGLELHIPPKQSRPAQTGQGSSAVSTPFILEKVVADGATLETLPADPQKDPLTFQISQLTMHSVGKSESMTFHAELNNAKPPGFIHSDGEFGPWNQDEPGDTPLSGNYTFSNADLSVFKGISGTLSSSGDYRGQLDRIDVHGTTDVPNFTLTMGGSAAHLRTEFNATVDGTNGNTDLHPVQALLGASKFEVTGSIERNALAKRKEIDLNASAKGTGLADFLRLVIKGQQPPMKGTIAFDTKVKIPPGDNPVIGRLQLDGSFTMNHVKFTSDDVQQKVASLSHHAQGEPKDTDTADVTAQFAGKFSMRDGILNLPNLQFDVPGAKVALNGKYGVQSGEINFRGTAKLDATVSQMTTGLKHVLLKPVDPLFRHDGAGTVLPIEISGTRGSPSFRLNIGKVLRDSGK